MKKREEKKVASVGGFPGSGKTILLIEVGKNCMHLKIFKGSVPPIVMLVAFISIIFHLYEFNRT